MNQDQKDTVAQVRDSIAASIAELEGRLFSKSCAVLVGDPYILVETQDPGRALQSMAGKPVVTLAPDLLTGVVHFTLERAQEVAAQVQAEGGPVLVPALARSWMLQKFDELNRQRIQLDDLLEGKAA